MVLSYFLSAITPFSGIELGFVLISEIGGFLLNLFYIYLLACIFLYALNHPEKRKTFIIIGIGLFLVMTLVGMGMNFLWLKSYAAKINGPDYR